MPRLTEAFNPFAPTVIPVFETMRVREIREWVALQAIKAACVTGFVDEWTCSWERRFPCVSFVVGDFTIYLRPFPFNANTSEAWWSVDGPSGDFPLGKRLTTLAASAVKVRKVLIELDRIFALDVVREARRRACK